MLVYTFYIGLGGNCHSCYGAPTVTLLKALAALRDTLPQTSNWRVASWYHTAPHRSLGDWYWNTVASAQWHIDVRLKDMPQVTEDKTARLASDALHDLLTAIFQVEKKFGRDRTNTRSEMEKSHSLASQRTVDIDILLFGDTVIDLPNLIIPHPRMDQRAFVLYPLAELAPNLYIHGKGHITELLAGVAGQGIVKHQPAQLLH